MSQFAAQPAASVIPEELLYGVDGAIATVTPNASRRIQFLPLMQTADMKEGIKAFLEKREPTFEGR